MLQMYWHSSVGPKVCSKKGSRINPGVVTHLGVEACVCGGITEYLQDNGVCIDSQCVEETQLVPVGEVVHEDAACIDYFSIASNHTVQESL